MHCSNVYIHTVRTALHITDTVKCCPSNVVRQPLMRMKLQLKNSVAFLGLLLQTKTRTPGKVMKRRCKKKKLVMVTSLGKEYA